jgi:hypothetical protein
MRPSEVVRRLLQQDFSNIPEAELEPLQDLNELLKTSWVLPQDYPKTKYETANQTYTMDYALYSLLIAFIREDEVARRAVSFNEAGDFPEQVAYFCSK